MQSTVVLKLNAGVLAEVGRHGGICGTTTALGTRLAKLQNLLLRLGRAKQTQGWQLRKGERGDQGKWHNHRGEMKSKRPKERKCVLKLEENQSERNRCGQADK